MSRYEYSEPVNNKSQISKMGFCYIRSRQNGMKKKKFDRVLGTRRKRKTLKRKRKRTKSAKRSSWTMEEDKFLMMLIQESGAQKWRKLALDIDGRNAKQCRCRYYNHLDPSINKRYVCLILYKKITPPHTHIYI